MIQPLGCNRALSQERHANSVQPTLLIGFKSLGSLGASSGAGLLQAGAAAGAGVGAFPRLVGMVFADPTAVLAAQTFHF
jgi:hypothetical protein